MKSRLLRPVILAGALLATAGGVAYATEGVSAPGCRSARPPHGVATAGAHCGRAPATAGWALEAGGLAKTSAPTVGPPGPHGPGGAEGKAGPTGATGPAGP